MASNSGTTLEVKVAAYFQSYGYYVKRGINVISGQEGSDATDVDALAINFTPTQSEERVIIDCKDKDRPKPYERILWVSGLQKYSEATRAVFSAPRIPLAAREFAMRGGVEILDVSTIDERLSNFKYLDYGYGAGSASLTSELELKWAGAKKESRELNSSYVDMLSTTIYGRPLTNLNRIINFSHKIYKMKLSTPDAAWIKRFICLEGASLFSLMLCRIAAETRTLRQDDREAIIKKGLTYGEIDPKVIERIYKITGMGEDPISPPDYANSILDLMNSLFRLGDAAKMASYCDLYIFGHSILKSGGISEDPNYKDIFNNIERPSKEIISAFSYSTGIPIEYLIRR